jgi:adenosylcobinamide-phosphate synthase
VGLDLLLSEPPNRYHPVAWMGRFIRNWTLRSPAHRNGARFASGVLLTLSGVAAFSLPWFFLGMADIPTGLAIALAVLGLKGVISLRRLLEAGKEVERYLQLGDRLPPAGALDGTWSAGRRTTWMQGTSPRPPLSRWRRTYLTASSRRRWLSP